MSDALLPSETGRATKRLPAPTLKASRQGNVLQVEPHQAETEKLIEATFATKEPALYTRLLNDLVTVGANPDLPPDRNLNELMAMVHGIAPRDETEAMLAVQMTATHAAAIKVLRLLSDSTAVIQQDSNGNLANKLLRTFTMQLDSLTRYRAAGKQQIVVNHVHVTASQAVVGVDMSKGGGGGAEN